MGSIELRDRLAARFMQACVSTTCMTEKEMREIAEQAYRMADIMLQIRITIN